MNEVKVKLESGEEVVLNEQRSPLDERDYIAETIFNQDIAVPSKLDLRKNLPPIRSQDGQGSCSAHVGACMKEYQEKKDIGLDEYMSPQFIYNNRINYPEPGMWPRNTMAILRNHGVCRERVYPYGSDGGPSTISKKIYDEAIKFKIKEYATIKTIETLKKALVTNGPCYISVPVYNYFSRMWKPVQDQKYLGGHALTVVGYDDNKSIHGSKGAFLLRNSWGNKWGDKGYCWFPYSDWGLHYEIWTTVDDKSKKSNKYWTKRSRILRFFKVFFLNMKFFLWFPFVAATIGTIFWIKYDFKMAIGPYVSAVFILALIGGLNFKREGMFK